MKTIIIITTTIISCTTTFAQNRIDAKYKNPGQQNTPNKFDNLEKLKSNMVDSLFVISPTIPKTAQQKKVDTYYEELKTFNQLGNEVWIYEDELFNGTKKKLTVGDYTLAKLGIFWNDKISSMLIPQSLIVQAFINDNFQNENTTLYGWGLASLQHSSNQSWIGSRPSINYYNGNSCSFKNQQGKFIADVNDNISSIKILANPNCCKP